MDIHVATTLSLLLMAAFVFCASKVGSSTLRLGGSRPATPPQPISDALKQRVQELVAQRKPVQAIKEVRQATMLGLKEAKDLVDAIAAGKEPANPVVPVSGYQPSEQLISYLQNDRKIDAIKQLREETGLGLKEAKDYIDAWSGNPAAGILINSGSPTAAEASERVLQLLRQGKKIEAIKRLREETGLGLKEAKDRLDAIDKRGRSR